MKNAKDEALLMLELLVLMSEAMGQVPEDEQEEISVGYFYARGKGWSHAEAYALAKKVFIEKAGHIAQLPKKKKPKEPPSDGINWKSLTGED
jgi:hypothetical protein